MTIDPHIPPSTIVAIDDSAANLLVLNKLIGKIPGCEAVGFTKAADALLWCKNHEPDLIVVDYMMPDIDGLEFVEEFHKISHCLNVPIMMITVADLREVRHRALDAGVNDFLGRPIDSVEFLARSRNMLRLRHTQRKIEEQLQALTRANSELERLLSAVTRELQPPINLMSNYLHLLQRRLEVQHDQELDSYVDTAFGGAQRMLTLVNDLVDFVRIGTSDVPPAHLDIRQVVEGALARLKPQIQNTHAVIEVDELPMVTGDPVQIRALFQHLLGNALKFCNETVPPQIRISAENADGYWRFAVADNGIGIPEEAQERIFLILERLHARERYEGSGTGLAACRKIVERHGGQMWVTSHPGEGSTFFFTLPDTPRA